MKRKIIGFDAEGKEEREREREREREMENALVEKAWHPETVNLILSFCRTSLHALICHSRSTYSTCALSLSSFPGLEKRKKKI
jgi:hypothetical protein